MTVAPRLPAGAALAASCGLHHAGCIMRAVIRWAKMSLMNEVTLRGDVIRLGQLLKLVDIVEAGSDVKALLATGAVTVNGEVEMRRGRQLVAGDQVSAHGVDVRVVSDVN